MTLLSSLIGRRHNGPHHHAKQAAYEERLIVKPRRIALVWTTIAALTFTTITAAPLPALAACDSCSCDSKQYATSDSGSGTTRGLIADQHVETRLHITAEFDDWELFLIDILFMKYFLPSMMLMTQQLSAVAMQQMMILGTFFDAKQQMETQRLFEQLKAEAHRDYHPSTGMCVFGTAVRSLAASERRAEVTQSIMAEYSQRRYLGHANTSGSQGNHQNKKDRVTMVVERYCQKNDNGTQLKGLCTTTPSALTVNRDIDYTRLIDRKMTLEIDFTDDQDPTDDEKDVLSMASNLYAHDVMLRVPESLFRGSNDSAKHRYMDSRSIAAKRSVAANSFHAIVGMRAMGSPEGGTPASTTTSLGPKIGPDGSAADTGKYLAVVLKQLGIEDDKDIKEMLGERPSYYAQMDILTKKLYQRPEFYTDLYDKPANVLRKRAAMQAIALMQDFDILKSYLRQEMMLAVLLETEIVAEQRKLDDRLRSLKQEGEREEQQTPDMGGP